MEKTIVKDELGYFRYKVDKMKEVILPISAIFNTGNLLIEATFTFKPGVSRTQRANAFINPNVTHMRLYREYKEIFRGQHFKVVCYTPLDSWTWDGEVGENAFVTAMYESAQHERCN